jgi:hypothetical protein
MLQLFHNIQRRFLSMPRRGTREEGANRSNRLAVAANDPPNVGLPHLQTKNRQAAARNFREHDFIGTFDELPNDELEKLSHAFDLTDAMDCCPICAFPLALGSAIPARCLCCCHNRDQRSRLQLFRCCALDRCNRGAGFVLFQKAADRVGRLGAARHPMLGPIQLERAVITRLLRIVGSDDFDEFSVARAAAIGNDDFVIRTILRPFSA